MNPRELFIIIVYVGIVCASFLALFESRRRGRWG